MRGKNGTRGGGSASKKGRSVQQHEQDQKSFSTINKTKEECVFSHIVILRLATHRRPQCFSIVLLYNKDTVHYCVIMWRFFPRLLIQGKR